MDYTLALNILKSNIYDDVEKLEQFKQIKEDLRKSGKDVSDINKIIGIISELIYNHVTIDMRLSLDIVKFLM